MDVIVKGYRLREADEAQRYLKRVFDFPDYYGMNLDALFDCLTDICEYTDIRIEYNEDDEAFEYFNRVAEVFMDASNCNSYLALIMVYKKNPVQDQDFSVEEGLSDEPEFGMMDSGEAGGYSGTDTVTEDLDENELEDNGFHAVT